MNKSHNKGDKKKNSSLSPKKVNSEYKALLKKARTEGLKVSYHFVTQKHHLEENKDGVKFVRKEDVVTAVQTINVSATVYLGRTLSQLKELFRETANDLGAKFYVIN